MKKKEKVTVWLYPRDLKKIDKMARKASLSRSAFITTLVSGE